MTEYNNYLETAKKAAVEAGKVLLQKMEEGFTIEYKGEIDLVTEADKQAQEMITTMIGAEYPDHEFLAEETATDLYKKAPYLWIIDPLDGTTNYAHGYKCFCVSIALSIGNEIVVGVVYDPCADEMFTAVKGGGAFLNGTPMSVSNIDVLRQGLLCTGFPYDIVSGKMVNMKLFNHFIMKSQAVRRDGSAALDLAYTAAGRFDGFWELKLHPWDIAAGVLLVTEAGGKISKFNGDAFDLNAIDILATNTHLHQVMVDEISSIPEEEW